jgi:two-component system NtrC family response regulator
MSEVNLNKAILIIEDENLQLSLYTRILNSEGYTVFGAQTLSKARNIFRSNQISVCIVDVRLPDGNGIQFLAEIKKTYPETEVIVFTNYGVINDGVTAIKDGAFDYIVKGEVSAKLISVVSQAMHAIARREQQGNLSLKKSKGFDSILGESEPIKQIKAMGVRVAATSANVLLLGETGVGKDIFAQAIHYASSRVNNSFVAINCSSIGPEMLESELFGYKAGAFTGAVGDKKGIFEEAHNGTIFLDEIGEMSLNLQSRILRVLENKSFIKLGDTKTTHVDCRLIAATHVDLLSSVKEGKFREDLYYRISSFVIKIPPLRERGKDVLILMHHYITLLSNRMNIEIPAVDPKFEDALKKYFWRGNVRELINVLERAIIMSSGTLTTDLLDVADIEGDLDLDIPVLTRLKDFERQYINKILAKCKGNKRKTARILDISITTLYRKLDIDFNG